MTGLSAIPELRSLDARRQLIRIPPELDVPLTPRVRRIVDSAAFRRLTQISQLGLVALVYPAAHHTRFEHSLGVYRLALVYLRQMAEDPRFCESVTARDAELLIVAALLHDIGHWPFCHPIEDIRLPDVPRHEQFARSFLEDAELADALRDGWGIEPSDVMGLLAEKRPDKRSRILRSILSGPIDIDKMDYLERDSLHAGVPYGRNFDRNRLIQSLLVNEAGDGLAITSKGKTAAELMVFARYVMFSEVYWHHAVRSATTMFARSFFELHRKLELRTLFQQSEFEVIAALRGAAVDTPSASLLDGVFGTKRKLHKRVIEFSLYQTPELYRALAGRPYAELIGVSGRVLEMAERYLGRSLNPTDLLIDAPPIHKEVEFKVDIFHPKEGVYRPLSQVSPVVAALAKTQFDDYVKRVRVFAEPTLARELTALKDFPQWLSDAAST